MSGVVRLNLEGEAAEFTFEADRQVGCPSDFFSTSRPEPFEASRTRRGARREPLKRASCPLIMRGDGRLAQLVRALR
jgi:hypothetical protein